MNLIKKIKPSFYTKAKIKIRLLLGIKTATEYQERRFPSEKFEMLYRNVSPVASCKTLLDIGCNAGKITAAFAEKGLFAVGVDVSPRIIKYPETERPIMGYYKVTDATIAAVPNFDIILLLSVHHQWVTEKGDAYAQELIARIIDKANAYMFIEFATLNSKYGYREPRFDEHDEESQKQYCIDWLNGCGTFLGNYEDFSITYVGKNRERIGVEEYRHTFMIEKKKI